MNKQKIDTWLALGLAMLSLAAVAGPLAHANDMQATSPVTKFAASNATKKLGLNEGIVEDIDYENHSVVLCHGRIQSKTVVMGPMTMPFNVANASLLNAVKVGDRVKFDAANVNGMPTLTALQVQR